MPPAALASQVLDGKSACTSLFEMNGVGERLTALRKSKHGRDCEELMSKLLTVSARRRITIAAAAAHPFVTAAA